MKYKCKHCGFWSLDFSINPNNNWKYACPACSSTCWTEAEEEREES